MYVHPLWRRGITAASTTPDRAAVRLGCASLHGCPGARASADQAIGASGLDGTAPLCGPTYPAEPGPRKTTCGPELFCPWLVPAARRPPIPAAAGSTRVAVPPVPCDARGAPEPRRCARCSSPVATVST